MQPTQRDTADNATPVSRIPRKAALRYFGDYVLLGEIAGGGMGIVYRALQTSLDREVAIKMIHSGALASMDAVRRFHTEAEAMAKLDHPNIVSIHEVGEHDGHHYFAMKLVDGPNLAEHSAGRPLDCRLAVEAMVLVARAVHYAHERGVLHRDLKPGNILLDERGQPHVTDFGIAKLVQRDGFTGTLSTLGTPEYMAPEQAIGKMSEVGTAADIYSLGAVLYFLLTGRPPFSGQTPFEIMDRVIRERPEPPSHYNSSVPAALDAICLKALAKKPAQRYGSAEHLARDLEGWLKTGQSDAGRIASGRPWSVFPAWFAKCAVVLLLIGTILGLLNRRSQRTENDSSARKASPNVAPTLVSPAPTPLVPSVVTKTNTAYVTRSPSGIIRSYRDTTTNGERIRTFSPTGRLQKEELERPDGWKETTEYELGDRVRKISITRPDGATEATEVFYAPSGSERLRETLVTRRGSVSKIVDSRPNLRTKGEAPDPPRNYALGPGGFVYQPLAHSTNVFAVWQDPSWLGSVSRPFTNLWDWREESWYRFHASYWKAADISDSPADWLVERLIAGYLADRFASMTTIGMIEAEIRLAAEDAEKARRVAVQTKDPSERAEAKAEQTRMESRAAKAETRLSKAKLAEKKRIELQAAAAAAASPVSQAIKSQLRKQVEQGIASAIRFSSDRLPGRVASDIFIVLQDTNQIHVVCKTLSITRAADSAPAGMLTAGDFLMLAPGQESVLKTATANTMMTMRVIASKWEEDAVPVGTLVAVPLREIQEFRNEFLAEIDSGMVEVDRAKEQFKQQSVLGPK